VEYLLQGLDDIDTLGYY